MASKKPSTSISRGDYIDATLLIVLTFAVYWPALHGGLVMDDARHITRLDLRSVHGLWRIWFELGATSQYYPLLHSAFWTEYQLWGGAVTGYHLVNVLLHAGSSLLLVAILKKLEIRGAWLAGFLFALHPLCVESVAWIAEQKNTLSTILYLGAALAYLQFDRSRARRPYWLALGLFVLALLSKSVTATLPAALLIVFWWKRGRVDIEQDVKPIAPFLVLGVGMGLFTAWVERTYIQAAGPDFSQSILLRMGIAGRVVWFYLSKILVPVGYMFVYPRWGDDVSPLWLLSVLAAIGVLVWYARRDRAPLAVFLIFLVTLVPVLGFLNVYPFLYSYVWDHFAYLAAPAVIALCAAGIARVIPERAGMVVVLGLGALTFVRAGTFRDGTTLYTDTLRRNPSAWLAHTNLAGELLLANQVPSAIEHLHAALQLRPQSPDAHYNLGTALASMPGHSGDAIQEYETAIRLKEDTPEAHDKLGRELMNVPGRQAEGIRHLERALEFNPDFADAHLNLGIALSRVPGRMGDALDHLETALRLEPGIPGGRGALELVLAQTPGRAGEAIGYFEEQVKQHPDSPEMQNALANALRNERDRIPEAILHFREALRLKPHMIEAHMNLANTLAQFPDRQQEAIAEYQAVLKLNPHFPEAHNNLGNAFAAIPGHTGEAMKEYLTAIADDPSSADPHVNLGAIYFNMPGHLADAIQQFQAAVRLDPGLADARTDLGLALLQWPAHDRNEEALAQFEASLRLKPDPELQQRVKQLRQTIDAQKTSLRPN
ncbi:MAG TPA: tetratricopeptide repeat protein [Bryobacteraceae bacterium]|nr:tetratricopeptide repeat protein [Bryobacteraceae bacterium]